MEKEKCGQWLLSVRTFILFPQDHIDCAVHEESMPWPTWETHSKDDFGKRVGSQMLLDQG